MERLFEYDILAGFNADCLDKIPNFKEVYLENNRHKSVKIIMDQIQEDFDTKQWPPDVIKIFAYPPFSGDVLQYMTEDEFMEYCALRYNVVWGEVVSYFLM